MNKRDYLQTFCNKYGDFKVAHRKGDQWSKHKSVLDIWHNEDEFWRYDKATDRTPAPCEIIIDIDPKEGTDTKERFNKALSIVQDYGFKYRAFFSGSRGYHIHIIEPRLLTMHKYDKEKFKEFLIGECDGDLAKKSESMMIALEYCPHPKTGNIKRLVGCSQ